MTKIVKQLGTIERHLHKKEIVELAVENAKAIVSAKQYDILKVYVELKRYETYIKGLIGELKTPAFEQAKKKNEKSFDYDEAKIRVSKTTKWNYSIDEEWVNLQNEIDDLITERKVREVFLKKANDGKEMVDEITGEIMDGFELPKEIKYGVSVSL